MIPSVLLGVRAGTEVQLEQTDREAALQRDAEGALAPPGPERIQLEGGAAGHTGQAGQPPSANRLRPLSSALAMRALAEGQWDRQPAATASTLDKLCPLKYGELRGVCASSLHAQALTHGNYSIHGVYIEAVCIWPEEEEGIVQVYLRPELSSAKIRSQTPGTRSREADMAEPLGMAHPTTQDSSPCLVLQEAQRSH